jgi:hypothetical protein
VIIPTMVTGTIVPFGASACWPTLCWADSSRHHPKHNAAGWLFGNSLIVPHRGLCRIRVMSWSVEAEGGISGTEEAMKDSPLGTREARQRRGTMPQPVLTGDKMCYSTRTFSPLRRCTGRFGVLRIDH